MSNCFDCKFWEAKDKMRDLTIISASVTLVVLIIALVVLVGILKVIVYAV